MSLSVIVVDDEPLIAEITTESLGESGFEAVVATNGEAALSLLRTRPDIRLMIADVDMPGMNGLQLAGVASIHRPDLKIIFMSGRARGGAFPLVRKPFGSQQLDAALRQNGISGDWGV